MDSQNDSRYIQEQLTDLLSIALAEVCLKRPADPIEYLAQWLYHKKDERDRLLKQKEEELIFVKQHEENVERHVRMRIYSKENEKEESGDTVDDGEMAKINAEEPIADAEKENSDDEDRYEEDAEEDITEPREEKSDDLADITEEVGDVDLSTEELTDGKTEAEANDNVMDEELINSKPAKDEEAYPEAQTEEKLEETQESNEDGK